MCRHAVTLRLNAKTFSFFLSLSGSKRERWIYGTAAACPGYCELAAFWSCQSVLWPPVCAGTLSGFTPVRRAELPTASPRCRTLLSLKLQPDDYWRWHISVLSADPPYFSTPKHTPPPRLSWFLSGLPTFEPPGAEGQKRPLLSKRCPGSPALFIYIKGDFEKVPQPQKDLCLYP